MKSVIDVTLVSANSEFDAHITFSCLDSNYWNLWLPTLMRFCVIFEESDVLDEESMELQLDSSS